MVDVILFDSDWYQKAMGQETESLPADASDESIAIARGIMFAGCVIAQAIDNAFHIVGHSEESVFTAMRDIADSVVDVAEIIREEHTQMPD